jgi:hypothetical protein
VGVKKYVLPVYRTVQYSHALPREMDDPASQSRQDPVGRRTDPSSRPEQAENHVARVARTTNEPEQLVNRAPAAESSLEDRARGRSDAASSADQGTMKQVSTFLEQAIQARTHTSRNEESPAAARDDQINEDARFLSRQALAERLTKLLGRSQDVNEPSLKLETQQVLRQCLEALQGGDQTARASGPPEPVLEAQRSVGHEPGAFRIIPGQSVERGIGRLCIL